MLKTNEWMLYSWSKMVYGEYLVKYNQYFIKYIEKGPIHS
jgi:hypothetical protein